MEASVPDRVPLHPERPEHHADRQIQPFEHRPLLDVQLQVRQRLLDLPVRLVHPVEVHAVLAQGIRQRNAVLILEAAHLVGDEGVGGCAGAEQAAAEAGALLVCPVHEPDGHGLVLFREHPEGFQSAYGVERAVEPAALGDGVYVAAEDDELFGITRGGGPEVSGLVGLYLAVYIVELALKPVAGLGPLIRPGHAAGAVRAAGEIGYFVQLLYRAAVVYVS